MKTENLFGCKFSAIVDMKHTENYHVMPQQQQPVQHNTQPDIQCLENDKHNKQDDSRCSPGEGYILFSVARRQQI